MRTELVQQSLHYPAKTNIFLQDILPSVKRSGYTESNPREYWVWRAGQEKHVIQVGEKDKFRGEITMANVQDGEEDVTRASK